MIQKVIHLEALFFLIKAKRNIHSINLASNIEVQDK